MATVIAAQMTPQGLLIPHAALREWQGQSLEVIKNKNHIVVRPRSRQRAGREHVLQILEKSGLLVKPSWEPTIPPVSPDELAELAEKLSVGQPLSEIIIAEREERW